MNGFLADQRELFGAIRTLGLRRLLGLRRAQKLAWGGMINGFYATRAMQTMFNVGFFDAVRDQKSVDVNDFAIRHDLDVKILRSLCETLFALNILKLNGTGYGLTGRGQLLIDLGRGWFDGTYGYEEVAHLLEPLLRKQREYGKDITRHADFVARGSGDIEGLVYFPLAIDEISRRGYRRVLDLGCGDGTFLRHMCARLPRISGCGIDLSPDAIRNGNKLLQAAGLSNRIDLMAHDIEQLDSAPTQLQSVDCATGFFILHEVAGAGEGHLIRFLRSFRRLLPGVPLMAFEPDRPTPEQMRSSKGMSISYFLQHDVSRQLPMARRQWAPFFREAGFEHIEERNLRFARTVIFTVR